MGRLPGFVPGSSEVVIGWRMWRTHLGGRDDVLGMTLNLADTPMVVTGVMPRRFDAPRIVYPAWTPPDVWMAHPSVPESDPRTLQVLGRLARRLRQPKRNCGRSLTRSPSPPDAPPSNPD